MSTSDDKATEKHEPETPAGETDEDIDERDDSTQDPPLKNATERFPNEEANGFDKRGELLISNEKAKIKEVADDETAKLLDEKLSLSDKKTVKSQGEAINGSKSTQQPKSPRIENEQIPKKEVPGYKIITTEPREDSINSIDIQFTQPRFASSRYNQRSESSISQLPVPGNYCYRGVTNMDYDLFTSFVVYRLNIVENGGVTAFLADGTQRFFAGSQLTRMFSIFRAANSLIIQFDVNDGTICNRLFANQETVNAIATFCKGTTYFAFRKTITIGLVKLFTIGNNLVNSVSFSGITICPATEKDRLGYDTIRGMFATIGNEVKSFTLDLRSTEIVSFNLVVQRMYDCFYIKKHKFDWIEIAAMKSCNRTVLSNSIAMLRNLLTANGKVVIFVHEYHRDFVNGLEKDNSFVNLNSPATYSMRDSETDIQWFNCYEKDRITFCLAIKGCGDEVYFAPHCYMLDNY